MKDQIGFNRYRDNLVGQDAALVAFGADQEAADLGATPRQGPNALRHLFEQL